MYPDIHPIFQAFNPSTRKYRVLAFTALLALSGCSKKEVEQVAFEPNLVHSMKYQIQHDLPMTQASEDAYWVVDTMFGTPDSPTLPQVILDDDDFASVVSLDNLHQASGPENAEGRGLYRLLCASCHGVSGDGRGPLAASQVPYPRDYRKGVFKFKSSERGSKPTKGDLRQIITDGIAGTNMTSIAKLLDLEKLKRGTEETWIPETIDSENIDALVDYVIYLSLRGEHERTQIDMGILEGIIEGDDRLINSDLGEKLEWGKRENRDLIDEKIEAVEAEKNTALETLQKKLSEEEKRLATLTEKIESTGDAKNLNPSEKREKAARSQTRDNLEASIAAIKEESDSLTNDIEDLQNYLEEWEYNEEYAIDIADAWLSAEEEIVDVPTPPEGIPVPNSNEEMLGMQKGDPSIAEALALSIERGREVFVGKVAACSKCHGEKGLGNGQTTDYDDWTKDWTSRAGLKPDDLEQLVPLLARGALKPQNARPRNFTDGIFRGGSSSENLYRRIIQGIEGSPMPAATFVEGEFEKDDIWHLINFIRSLGNPAPSTQSEKEVEETATARSTIGNSNPNS